MKVLLIGSGGREHAIAWKLAQSDSVARIHVNPGNGGTETEHKCHNLSFQPDDYAALAAYAECEHFNFAVVGPEQPLSNGIVDYFDSRGLRIFGPTKDAARLESSKAFAKNFMKKHQIPTAGYEVFSRSHLDFALDYLTACTYPIVVKADGLAAGKGVVICETRDDAGSALDEILVQDRFGKSGDSVVIEDFLAGEEASLLVIVDKNQNYFTLPQAQDYKKAQDNDAGKNTGGMGAYCPARILDEDALSVVEKEIIVKTIEGMQSIGTPFTGCLYLGLMMTKEGPKLLEYNVRFGDPETQAILPVLDLDLAFLFHSAIEGELDQVNKNPVTKTSCSVVMASGGYPDEYETGFEIKGIEKAERVDGVKVFHAGTRFDSQTRRFYTTGGRVLGVTGIGNSLDEAIIAAYNAVDRINFENKCSRTDIGRKGLTH